MSEGCRNCYAERIASRFQGGKFLGFAGPIGGTLRHGWTGKVALIPEKLDEPLRWKKPRRVFVNSMSDLFHESLYNERSNPIGKVLGVMAEAHWHTFQVLTKRAKVMLEWSRGVAHYPRGDRSQRPVAGWPPNVWLGVSVEDQATADERIPLLLQTPASVRFASVEPMLGPVDLTRWLTRRVPWAVAGGPNECAHGYAEGIPCVQCQPGLSWVIVGGESGPGARPFDVAWARETVRQCREAGVPCFVKQLGPRPVTWIPDGTRALDDQPRAPMRLRDRKGGNMSEWPSDLRVREFPKEA